MGNVKLLRVLVLTANTSHTSFLRQMVYSLSRFRFLKPVPPFHLGGEYLGRQDQHFLKDAMGSVELEGKPELFTGLGDGDLVVARVTSANEFSVYAKKIDVAVKAQAHYNIAPKPHASRFTMFVNRIRDFFLEQGFDEVYTPSLVKCPGLEPTLEPFDLEVAFGRHKLKVYLPTSPEIHLKKAMVAGWTDTFEIKPCYRRGEFSTHHDNEFLMLEWYRGFADLGLVEMDLRRLIRVLGEEGWVESPAKEVNETDWSALFKSQLEFDLTPATTRDELKALCERVAVHSTNDDSFNDLFHRLVVDRMEPELARLGPVIVKRFPPSMAALAKLDDGGWADRFELYWRGLEIANAFNEVNDPEEQAARWVAEQQERARLGTSAVPHDPALIRAYRRGMPPSGGIALGLERLYMACARVTDIQELKLFSVADLFSR